MRERERERESERELLKQEEGGKVTKRGNVIEEVSKRLFQER